MRWVLAFVLALSSLVNVAVADNVAPPLAALNRIVSLVSKAGSEGHGTIVGPNTIITVAHVAAHAPLRWRDSTGTEGAVTDWTRSKVADVAWLTTKDTFVASVPLIQRELVEGETVWFRLYIDEDKSVWNSGHYLGRSKDGAIVLDAMAWPGSSGSALLTADGQVAGMIRNASRPGYCSALLATFNMQALVDCLMRITLTRAAIEAVPVEAFR